MTDGLSSYVKSSAFSYVLYTELIEEGFVWI